MCGNTGCKEHNSLLVLFLNPLMFWWNTFSTLLFTDFKQLLVSSLFSFEGFVVLFERLHPFPSLAVGTNTHFLTDLLAIKNHHFLSLVVSQVFLMRVFLIPSVPSHSLFFLPPPSPHHFLWGHSSISR